MKQPVGGSVSFTLIGEEISGDWNAQALADVAHAFGGEYAAYAGHSSEQTRTNDTDATDNDTAAAEGLSVFDGDLLNSFDWLLGVENRQDAHNIYALKPPVLQNRALVVGNKAKGLRRRTLKQTHAVAEIPMVSQNINCLNVAAAAAIILYYLSVNEQRHAPLGQSARTLNALQKARPDILLLGGHDFMELGSVVRSACAFGWERVFLADRHNAWYACDRLMKSEGRGAARRGRNPIKVIPCPADLLAHYKTVVVVTCERETGVPHKPAGTSPLHQVQLTKRPDGPVLIVLPDESANAQDWMDWLQAAREQHCVIHAHLPAIASSQYHYRQSASIALAEVARQLGKTDGKGIYLHTKKQRYQKALEVTDTADWIELEDLRMF